MRSGTGSSLRWQAKASILMGALAALLAACQPIGAAAPLPTKTSTPTAAPTATVIWFPPTDTPTPLPTVIPSPTVELRPGIGAELVHDAFDVPGLWSLNQVPGGTASIAGNELTLAIVQPKVYLASLRSEPTLADFYAEITASPRLCSGTDQYGLLFRFQSQGYFYRFALSCDGQARLDRVVGGTAGSPQDWLPSASVPAGAPGSSRLGVWVRGKEMRFFVNDEFQFSVQDAYLDRGQIGVFARSAGENALTVSFSELAVYEINP
jgi:hypothetical protein